MQNSAFWLVSLLLAYRYQYIQLIQTVAVHDLGHFSKVAVRIIADLLIDVGPRNDLLCVEWDVKPCSTRLS